MSMSDDRKKSTENICGRYLDFLKKTWKEGGKAISCKCTFVRISVIDRHVSNQPLPIICRCSFSWKKGPPAWRALTSLSLLYQFFLIKICLRFCACFLSQVDAFWPELIIQLLLRYAEKLCSWQMRCSRKCMENHQLGLIKWQP